MNQFAAFQVPTRIIFGEGAVAQTGSVARRLGTGRAFVVSDPGVTNAGITQQVLDVLDAAGIAYDLFTDVEPDPPIETAERGTAQLLAAGAQIVVAVGGGSPLGVAKAMALSAANPGDIRQFEGKNRYKAPPLPVIAIPTTAGSGSEVSWAFVLTDVQRNHKLIAGGDDCYPEVAILDPGLLRSLPLGPLLDAALDAFSHALEALWSKRASSITDPLAITACKMIIQSLPDAIHTDRLEPRSDLLVASTMANMACGNTGLGVVHGLSAALCTRYHLPHGYVNGVLIPYGMEYNRALCESKFASLARQLNPDVRGDHTSLAAGLIARVREMYNRVGVPLRFPQEHLRREEIPDLVETALRARAAHFEHNVRPSTPGELSAVLEQAAS